MVFPTDIPLSRRPEFRKNYLSLTKGTDHLFLFAADHKIEHLDEDFYGSTIDPAAHDPRHLFSIARQPWIGGFATQLGLIARYGHDYPSIPYVVKLNSKTNLISLNSQDPFSQQLWTVDDVLSFKKRSRLLICAVGITIYLGSTYEAPMLAQAAQAIYQAHQQGLLALVWVYPRGKAVSGENEGSLLAGAAGVAAALGADFVKLHPPVVPAEQSMRPVLERISQAAGTTKVIYAGGATYDSEQLLHTIKEQLEGGSAGVAIGRNIYQHSLHDALELSQKIASLVYKKDFNQTKESD